VSDGRAHFFDVTMLLNDDGGRYHEHKKSAAANTVVSSLWTATFRCHQILLSLCLIKCNFMSFTLSIFVLLSAFRKFLETKTSSDVRDGFVGSN
jgi:hypothetical protein